MGKDYSSMEDSNRSGNPSIHEVSAPRRRQVLQGGLGAALAGLLAPLADQEVRDLIYYLTRLGQVPLPTEKAAK